MLVQYIGDQAMYMGEICKSFMVFALVYYAAYRHIKLRRKYKHLLAPPAKRLNMNGV